MKERILSRWSFMRILWLVMGVGISIQAVNERNFLMLIPGIYFVFGAIANVGCFAGACATGLSPSKNRQNKEVVPEVEYEEVSSKH